MSEHFEQPGDGFDDIREKLAAALQLDEGVAAPSGLSTSVDAALAAERGVGAWLSSRSTGLRFALATLAVLLAGAAGAIKLRVDAGAYPQIRLMIELCVPLVLALLAIGRWLRPMHKPPPSIPLEIPLLVLMLVALPVASALMPSAHAGHPASLLGVGDDLAKRALGCLMYGSALGIPVGLLLSGLGRRETSLLLATAAGALAGYVGLFLHCPITGRMHLLLGHMTMPVVASLTALVVVLIARRVRRGRRGS
ncbi:MAG: hypothetical protein KC503_05050 [Myxococcales bacterium]|nr:hypothetical protein [Myxococcales bacterium]